MFFKKKKDAGDASPAAKPPPVPFNDTSTLSKQRSERQKSEIDSAVGTPFKVLTLNSLRNWGQIPEDVIQVNGEAIYWIQHVTPMARLLSNTSFISIRNSDAPDGPLVAICRISDVQQSYSPGKMFKPKESFRYAIPAHTADFDPDPEHWSPAFAIGSVRNMSGAPFSLWLEGRQYEWRNSNKILRMAGDAYGTEGCIGLKLVDIAAKDFVLAMYYDQPKGPARNQGLWGTVKVFAEMEAEVELACVVTALGARQVVATQMRESEAASHRRGGLVGNLIQGAGGGL